MNNNIKNKLKFVAIMLCTHSMLLADKDKREISKSEQVLSLACGYLSEGMVRRFGFTKAGGTPLQRSIHSGIKTFLMASTLYTGSATVINIARKTEPHTSNYIRPWINGPVFFNLVVGETLSEHVDTFTFIRQNENLKAAVAYTTGAAAADVIYLSIAYEVYGKS